MAWFITVINSKKNDKRCVGFFNDYNTAHKYLIDSGSTLHEAYYDLIVVEYIESGMFPSVLMSEWWKFNNKYLTFSKLDHTPKKCLGITNWAIG